MKLKIIRGVNNVGRQILQISTNQTTIAIGFGEDKATAEMAEQVNPMLDGLTCGNPAYDAVFILRNPENCNLVDFTLSNIPIFLEKKLRSGYRIYSEFTGCKMRNNIKEVANMQTLKIKDLNITYFLVDGSNFNTSMLLVESEGKKVLVSGDFRSFNLNSFKKELNNIIYEIGKVDYWFIEGKYFGKTTLENLSEQETFTKLKNIMKFYKQVFIIQSETDLATTKRVYDVSLKTKKIFIEETFLANLTTTCTGSAPNPITDKKVYTYNPLVLDNKDFEFKKKYVAHFYIHNAHRKMKKENYAMNINMEMLQDIQVFKKEDAIYDACVILAISKHHLKERNGLEEFINLLKDMDIDYYELYEIGCVNFDLINGMMKVIKPDSLIPIDFNLAQGDRKYNIRSLRENEVLDI